MTITVDGTTEMHGTHTAYRIDIDDNPTHLPYTEFRLFWVLCEQSPRWVRKDVLWHPEYTARYLWRMKCLIQDALHIEWTVYENDRKGNYRLNTQDGTVITINPDLRIDDNLRIVC